MMRVVNSSGSCSSLSCSSRIERRQVVEEDLLARLLRLLEVDRLDLEQREVALALLRRADLARDDVAGAQVEAPDLGRRDVDVVGAGQVVVVGRAQEAEAVGQDLEHALAVDWPFCSACACRIAKISSCLRSAAAPSMLMSLASAASSPIFLSFRSLQVERRRLLGGSALGSASSLACVATSPLALSPRARRSPSRVLIAHRFRSPCMATLPALGGAGDGVGKESTVTSLSWGAGTAVADAAP